MGGAGSRATATRAASTKTPYPLQFSEEGLRRKLSRQAYDVTQRAGTERAWTSPLLGVSGKGVFECVVCNSPLYSTQDKFDSGTGWPSFYRQAVKGAVETLVDRSHGMDRIEARCAKCGAHLGHVFDEGSHTRHCINGVSLEFKPGVDVSAYTVETKPESEL